MYRRSSSGALVKWYYCLAEYADGTFVVRTTVTNGVHERYFPTLDKAATFIKNNIKEKTANGYRDTKKEALEFVDSRVMLSKKEHPDYLASLWDKMTGKMLEPAVIAQPKLNGMRVVQKGEGFYSRLDNKLPKLKLAAFNLKGDYVYPLDGEMYAHGYPLEDIISMVKGSHPDRDKLTYYIFDQLIPDETYVERLAELQEYDNGTKVRVISSKVITSLRDLEEYFKYCDEHFEGMMVKTLHDLYEFGKRSQASTKVKRPITEEFVICGLKRDSKGRVIYQCVTPEKEVFDVVPQLPHDVREFDNTYFDDHIGQLLTVEFYEYTKKKVPRHASGITIRDYE